MKTQTSILLILTLSYLTCAILTAQPAAGILDRQYRIEPGSSLVLKGTTNVNKFSCDCLETFPVQQFTTQELDDEVCTIHFANTELMINVRSLDCGNKMMNKDLGNALGADAHPVIQIALKKAEVEKCFLNEQSTVVVDHGYAALVHITIHGVTNAYWLRTQVYPIGKDKIRLTSTTAFPMSDFNIKPPTAALGMVKVNDEISINLDLHVSLL